MAEPTEYEVVRAHEGDQYYAVGDTRKALASEVAHLIGKTLVEKKAEKPKAQKGK